MLETLERLVLNTVANLPDCAVSEVHLRLREFRVLTQDVDYTLLLLGDQGLLRKEDTGLRLTAEGWKAVGRG